VKSPNWINVDKDLEDAVAIAKKIYLEGGVFIYPTDTIYGFGANPFNDNAIQRINEIKGRANWKRYILLISNIEDLRKYVEFNYEKHIDFLISIWPNPVSFILNLNKEMRSIFNAETCAFRIPNNRFCLSLLESLKMPLISTSVNRTEQDPINDPQLIKYEFADEVDAIFHTEKKSYFLASTLIDLTTDEPKLVREGNLKFAEIMKKYK
jgi:L-threonylcarbamoyladenylate synthase